MEGLMYICKNWGDDNCDLEVSIHEIPMWLDNPDLTRLDSICRRCDFRSFKIEEKTCPVCGGEGFLEVERSTAKENGKIYETCNLKCNQCKTPLEIKKLIRRTTSLEGN